MVRYTTAMKLLLLCALILAGCSDNDQPRGISSLSITVIPQGSGVAWSRHEIAEIGVGFPIDLTGYGSVYMWESTGGTLSIVSESLASFTPSESESSVAVQVISSATN